MFLKLKKKIGKNLSNKEVMRKILEMVDGVAVGITAKSKEINTTTDHKVVPGDNFSRQISIPTNNGAKPKNVPGDKKATIKIMPRPIPHHDQPLNVPL